MRSQNFLKRITFVLILAFGLTLSPSKSFAAYRDNRAPLKIDF